MSEVDIFADLSTAEMDTIAAASPHRRYASGVLLYLPTDRVELLFVLKHGRVRLFRVSADGRALTTAILSPGTIFGEMVPVGPGWQRRARSSPSPLLLECDGTAPGSGASATAITERAATDEAGSVQARAGEGGGH